MKHYIAVPLCAAILVVMSPFAARPQESQESSVNANQAQQDAAMMVPAHASLRTKLNAKQSHAGEEIRAELERTIQLKNGPELPHGTQLLGEVTAVEAKPDKVRLALRFDEAQLRDGSKIPIKAMILFIQSASSVGTDSDLARVSARDVWTPNIYKVDQLGTISGADLHSSITSDDSGVITSNKKDDLTIGKGSEIDLVIEDKGAPKAIASTQ